MTLGRFRAICLALPGATEQLQWDDDAVFKVGGRMFAVAGTRPGRHAQATVCSFKCADERFAELVERQGIVPAPYLARAKWVALDRWDALSDREITDAVAGSYRLVRARLPRAVQRALDG